MIHIITAENRHLFRHALMEMHRQRKAVFIDELGWPLQAEAGIEIDAYDGEDVVYLIESDGPRACVGGSARLLPTVRGHLLQDVFADLPRGLSGKGSGRYDGSVRGQDQVGGGPGAA